MNEQAALLKLLQIPQLGAQRIARLLSEADFNEFCRYDKWQLQQIGWNEKQIRRWFHPEMRWIENALAWAEKENQRMLTLFDADYPFLLRQISTAPPVLFVRGTAAALSLPQIAIVGSRDYSPYGEYWAGYFAAELVKRGIAVTSGLAIGIDGFCHRRAVAEGGVTIAVLGSGLDRIYPARHKKLAAQIVETGGALVSEFFPEQPPLAENFPRRNRIISGLSLGTLVVEASLNSGSLITARYALEQGREVFALPHAVQSQYAAGCHQLIKEGALLTETAEDILQAVRFQMPAGPYQNSFWEPLQAVKKGPKLAKPPSMGDTVKNPPEMTACQRQIFSRLSLEASAVDELAKATDISVEMLLVELLDMELAGLIRQVGGGYVRA